ncbi:MAG: hypothetical protein ACLQIB_16205 [Isosphaeraceae bacterium]
MAPTCSGRAPAAAASALAGGAVGFWADGFARQGGPAAPGQPSGVGDGADLLAPPSQMGHRGTTLAEFWAKRLEIGILIDWPITECLTWEEAAP